MDDLHATLRVIRIFALCMWRRSDPKRPSRLASSGMCCSTSQLVTALLNRREPGWETVSGYFTTAPPPNNGWHCWSQHKDGRIVDLTADQFGDRKIVITNDGDSRYDRRGEWSESDEWLRYYDIWIIPRRKRRLSINQITQMIYAKDLREFKARGGDPRDRLR